MHACLLVQPSTIAPQNEFHNSSTNNDSSRLGWGFIAACYLQCIVEVSDVGQFLVGTLDLEWAVIDPIVCYYDSCIYYN